MRRSMLGLLAATALTTGLGGCSLPHVLPLSGGTTSGPSPYGVWYEQHWATNSVLLAAADQVDENIDPVAYDTDLDLEVDLEAAAAAAEAEYNGEPLPGPVDASLEMPAADPAIDGVESVEFSNSSPYQFPSSSFNAPAAGDVPPAPDQPLPAPASSGPLRY